MLILVAVTVNFVNNKGGLLEKTREAKQGTAYKSEEENLLTYIYGEGVYNAITGKVDLKALKNKLAEDSDKWKTLILDNDTDPTKLTVTGVQSGEEHIINEDCTKGDKKEPTSTGAVGKYMTLFSGESSVEYIEFKENNQLEIKAKKYDSTTDITTEEKWTGSYEYNANTNIVTITGEICKNFNENGDDLQCQIQEINYKKDSKEGINKVLIINNVLACSTDGFAGFDKYTFTSGTYKNSENKTLELSIKTDENGNSYGYLVVDGTDKTSYICLNGYIYDGFLPYRIVSETEIEELNVDGEGISVFTKVD